MVQNFKADYFGLLLSMELKVAIGKALKGLRTEKGLTQEKLAELCDLNVIFISRIENGKRQPSLKTLFKMSKAMEIKLSVIIERAESQFQD